MMQAHTNDTRDAINIKQETGYTKRWIRTNPNRFIESLENFINTHPTTTWQHEMHHTTNLLLLVATFKGELNMHRLTERASCAARIKESARITIEILTSMTDRLNATSPEDIISMTRAQLDALEQLTLIDRKLTRIKHEVIAIERAARTKAAA